MIIGYQTNEHSTFHWILQLRLYVVDYTIFTMTTYVWWKSKTFTITTSLARTSNHSKIRLPIVVKSIFCNSLDNILHPFLCHLSWVFRIINYLIAWLNCNKVPCIVRYPHKIILFLGTWTQRKNCNPFVLAKPLCSCHLLIYMLCFL